MNNKLVERARPFATHAIVFRVMDQVSEDICFNSEVQCDQVFDDIIKGKGLLVRKNITSPIIRIYPTWAAKFQVIKDFILPIEFNKQYEECIEARISHNAEPPLVLTEEEEYQEFKRLREKFENRFKARSLIIELIAKYANKGWVMDENAINGLEIEEAQKE